MVPALKRHSFSRRHALRACGAAALLASARPAISQSLPIVRVGASFDEGLTPVLYGMQSGIFTRHGVAVELHTATSGAALASAVAGGSIDIAKSSLMALIAAHSRGVYFKIIAASALHLAGVPTNDILVPRDSPIRSGADANGKTVGVLALGSLDVIGVSTYVDTHGGNSATLKFIELPFTAMVPALQQGRIDLATVANPTMTAAIESGMVRVLAVTYDAVAKRFLLGAWFSTQEYVQKNLDVAQRFREAEQQAAAYTNSHHEETVPILAAYAKIDPEVIRKMTRDVNGTAIDPNEIQIVIDAAARYKLINERFSARDFLI